ncbi:Uncharacterised protein g4825 [Pycnogonum litorale]
MRFKNVILLTFLFICLAHERGLCQNIDTEKKCSLDTDCATGKYCNDNGFCRCLRNITADGKCIFKGTIGDNCTAQFNCGDNEVCYNGLCKCNISFVEIKEICYPATHHGGSCTSVDQCVDSDDMCDIESLTCLCKDGYQWSVDDEKCDIEDLSELHQTLLLILVPLLALLAAIFIAGFAIFRHRKKSNISSRRVSVQIPPERKLSSR